jgi:quinoprotein glucose dehydrogenase
MIQKIAVSVVAVAALIGGAASVLADRATVEWPFYGGDQGGMKYSVLDRVNRQNVAKLRVAWT